jgi:hypothetical protein
VGVAGAAGVLLPVLEIGFISLSSLSYSYRYGNVLSPR